MSRSVSSIVESARGDLDTDILEEIESDYGFGFLEPDEQIQYIGLSIWGVRIKRIQYVNSKLGSRTISLITDRSVRLVISNGEDSWDSIAIDYDEIKGIEYNKGVLKESITITTDYYRLDVESLKIGWSESDTSVSTIRSPSIKFRLRASENSGSSIEAIVSYMQSRIEQLPLETKYDELVNQVSGLDHKESSAPSPQSFDSPDECKKKYDDLEGEIKKWSVAESKFNEVKESRSKIIDQLPAHNRETWVRIVPNIDTPKEFDTADEAISEYVSGFGKDLERIAEILTVSSRLVNEEGDLPIEPFLQEVIEHLQEEGTPESEKLQEWYDLIQKVEKISMFMNDVDLSHPSIDAEHWEESIEMALEEQYVNILSPIVDQVEKMESGMWELDDLHQISWQEFESLIGTLYESFGYETEVTSDTADLGIDVWARNSDERVAIQAKRYQEGNTVGREALQKLASTLAKGDADRVIVVTTSEFARTAKEYSDSFGSEIELIDGEELRDQLNNSDIPPIN